MTEQLKPEKIEALLRLIDQSNEIAIITHVNPDGDAIGSSLAWQAFLRERGKAARVIVPNPFPDFLKWMEGSGDILVYSGNRKKCEETLAGAELLFCLDFNSLSRLDALGRFLETLNPKKVLIDHHIGTVERGFDLAFSKVAASSTSEIVYRIIRATTGVNRVAPRIAEALYAGIMTDTGAFAHSCDPDLFRLAADLMECGIDRAKIHALVYSNFSEHRMRLMAHCLSNKMEVLPEHRTAIMSLTREELDRFRFEPGDTEGFVNIPLGIKGVIFSVFFVESKDEFIKLSLRSVGNFSVDSVARKYFNGGGHKNASGGKIFAPMNESIALFKSILPKLRIES
ncbi:MAG: bifunctional oligoribonuclease/PAP phosphatase NrnA [Prevotellaceae bacterium]|jgi:phosphoesterase RecJ-like protein|nr:bifunctional oligoribonuclease/PAP phosphatase NrnA [Prevotellaceae bacterium]